MATSINQSFLELKTNLEITDLQGSTVSTRQSKVRKVVEAGLTVLDSFLTGSYARGTMISPLTEADIDVFVVLESKYFYHYNGQNGGQEALLRSVKEVLRKTYTKTPSIRPDGQAVTIRFTDFLIDVVPAFYRKGGGFLIPDSTRQCWISTDPKAHVSISTKANAAHDDDLVPLVKMLKAWNRTAGQYFRGFHLEVLAWSILNNVTISDFPSGVRFFFDKAREAVGKQNLDPSGYGGDIGHYISSHAQIETAVAKFQLAYERALKAEKYEQGGYTAEAVEMWRKIFGDYYPAYG